MDLQALTFVKLADNRTVRFDPGNEDEYYDAAVVLPRFMSGVGQGISRTITLLRTGWQSRRQPQGWPRKPKVMTG